MKSFALALGGGGARGLAHIAVLEALDEMGAQAGRDRRHLDRRADRRGLCVGHVGQAIRRFVIALAHDRAEVFRRLLATRAGTFADLFSTGFGGDSAGRCREVLHPVPAGRRCRTSSATLAIPLTVDRLRSLPAAAGGVLVGPAQAGARRLDRAADRDAAGGGRGPRPDRWRRHQSAAVRPAARARRHRGRGGYFGRARPRSGATFPIRGSACSPPSWSWAAPSPPRSSSTARPT